MSVHDYSAYWLPAREERGGLSRAVAWRRAEWNDPYMKNRAEREERDWWHIHKTTESPSMPDAVNPKQLRAAADGKVPLEYLEPALETPLAHVMKHGADKYGLRNYRDTPCKISTYVGAIRRHTLAWQQGEDIDPDSGQPHLAHIAACCAVMLGAENAGTRVDDRHEKFSTPLSDRVHADGDMGAKALTAEYSRGIDELAEEFRADAYGDMNAKGLPALCGHCDSSGLCTGECCYGGDAPACEHRNCGGPQGCAF